MFIWVLLAIIVVIIAGVILIYNGLVAKRLMSDNGWSDITVQLQRRADLIPQIVETVKAYAKHEKELFVDVIEKRNAALAAGDDTKNRGLRESALARPVGKLIALKEDYPELKAAQNFLDLQNELADTEDKIEMARRFYNGAVREQNVAVQSFPANLIAGLFGFNSRDFFEIEIGERANPVLDFSDN